MKMIDRFGDRLESDQKFRAKVFFGVAMIVPSILCCEAIIASCRHPAPRQPVMIESIHKR